MPHLLSRIKSSKPPRTTAALTGAAALAIALALTACTSASSTPATAQASAAGTSAVQLTGAGSTFDAPFFTKAFAAYQQASPGVCVNYASVGSSAGIARFTAGTVNFGATDVPASTTDLIGARGGPAVQVPVDLGGISVAYNVLTRNGTLKLTGPVLARTFLGQITRWNDPAITALNPGADLPDTYGCGGRPRAVATAAAGRAKSPAGPWPVRFLGFGSSSKPAAAHRPALLAATTLRTGRRHLARGVTTSDRSRDWERGHFVRKVRRSG